MLEHGAYTQLIQSCYDRERFPTHDEAIDWVWARSDEEVAAVKFVLGRFFTFEDGVYVQSRIKEEIDAYNAVCVKNAEIATEREARRKKNKRDVDEACTERGPSVHDASTNRHLTTNHKPLTTNQEPRVNPNHNPPIGLTASECDERPSEPKTEIAKPKQPSLIAEPPGFVAFWAEYPKKAGRKSALSAWQSKRLEPRADGLIADVRLRSGTDRKWLDGFAPNPATYLNQERWNDEIERGANAARASPNKPSAGEVTMRNFENVMRKMDAEV